MQVLCGKECDIFSRGVNEIFPEFEKYAAANPNITIEKNMLLYYPYPFYFFVTPSDPELAKRIETGLRQMIKDGSYDAIFWKYNGKVLARARMKERRIIRLKNPNVPPRTPLDDPQLWYMPNTTR